MSENTEAYSLMSALGPHAGPAPVTMNVVTLKTGDGQQWVIPIISHPFGRVAPWLTPDDAEQWGTMIVQNAKGVKARPAPLHVARTMPKGMVPGTGHVTGSPPPRLPNGRLN